MGGTNPYLDDDEAPLPTRPYRITYRTEHGERVVEVDPEQIPYSRDGRPGSLLEIALGHGIELDHACGGVCACSTCHVVVRQGLDVCNPASEGEEDQLDNAPGLTPHSRLACQCVPQGGADLVVEVPEWNRNAVSEEEH